MDAQNAVEQVILVHGTFASSKDDCGEGWWQVGSKPYNALKKRLPANVSLVPEGRVFRWSGDNTERARSKAAASLLKYLEPLERSGTRYHLIGHSHGGSVIWSALRLATSRKRKLDQLQSWSTVGTPFLQQQTKSPWNPISLAYMLLAMALLYPACKTFYELAKLPYDVARGNLVDGFLIKSDAEVDILSAMVRLPIVKVLEQLGVAFTPTDGGIRVGSFDPQSGESVGHFLFGTLEGWLILSAIILFGYIMTLLGSYFLSFVSESMRIGWEKGLEKQAFETYGKRWLGLWTQDDEAINGLRATMELSVPFIGDLAARERVFLSDLLSLPWQPLFQCFAPVYNRVVRPVLNSKIREIVIRTAQGNDRPSAHIVAVSPHPTLPPPESSAPPLPEQLGLRIRDQANRYANDLGPKIRQLLAQPSLTAGLEAFSHTISGRELVHTSYFDHPDVIELLVMNIDWSRHLNRPRRSSTLAEIKYWFDDFKQLQGAAPKRECSLRSINRDRTGLADDKRAA